MSFKISTRPKEGFKNTINLPNDLLGKNEKGGPVHLHRKENGLNELAEDKASHTSVRQSFIGPTLHSFGDPINERTTISSPQLSGN